MDIDDKYIFPKYGYGDDYGNPYGGAYRYLDCTDEIDWNGDGYDLGDGDSGDGEGNASENVYVYARSDYDYRMVGSLEM